MRKFIYSMIFVGLFACNSKHETPKPGHDTVIMVPVVTDTAYKPPVHLASPKTVTKTRTVYRDRVYYQKKKRVSGTAKGAIIGGVAGAAGGAILSKKHKGRNAVIGGVVGAGAGAVIGKKLDKHKN